MTPILLSGPAIEPVSLQEAKNWLRVEGNGDDMLIQALITSARLIVEARTATMLITQRWRCILDAWPISAIVEIPLKPLQGIDEIRTRAQTETRPSCLRTYTFSNPELGIHGCTSVNHHLHLGNPLPESKSI